MQDLPEDKRPHTFMVLPADAEQKDVLAGYALGVDMVLTRSDDLADALRRFA